MHCTPCGGPTQPCISIIGMAGAGKSTVGQALAQRLGSGLQLGVGERFVVILQREDLVRDGTDLFQLLIGNR